ncbi:unnamed protein product [Choristocarpus tenellus]
MSDFLNLNSRASKFQREQEKRREAARFRIEKERRAKQAAARMQAQVEEQIRKKKLEQLRKEELVRKRADDDLRRTGGISYNATLRAVPANGEGDKILLPPSALESLSRQDAVSLGPMFFELTHVSDGGKGSKETRSTHGGVLEFVAEEGTVGLPPKVVISLGGKPVATEELGEVMLRYVRLNKATFARVIPETVGLSQISELRAMLEHNMRNHATLTVGDHLQVWRRGREFSMKVVELRPEPEATLIDTDIEIDLELPEEVRKEMEEQSARDRLQTLRTHIDFPQAVTAGTARDMEAILAGVDAKEVAGGQRLRSATSEQGKMVGVSETAVRTQGTLSPMDTNGRGLRSSGQHMVDSDSDSDLDEEEFNPEAHRLAKSQALPEEPVKGGDGVVTCQVRGTQGQKFSRRFHGQDRLSVLFDFAEANGALPGRYRLVVPFPRRVLSPDESSQLTLSEAGLTSKQEALILERC